MLTLLTAELKRAWSVFKAYPVDQVLSTVILAVFFYILFFGAKYMAGPSAQFGSRLDSIVVGYILWLLALANMQDTSSTWRNEATTGTLEQLMISPYGPVRIFLMRSIADTTVNLTIMSGVSVLIVLVTHAHMHFSPAVILPVLTVLAGANGLGFMISSLVLRFKRMDSIGQIINFLLIALIMLPMETWKGAQFWVGAVVPLAPGSALLRLILVQQTFDFTLLAIALVNCAVYFTLGAALFRMALINAKKRGLVGKY